MFKVNPKCQIVRLRIVKAIFIFLSIFGAEASFSAPQWIQGLPNNTLGISCLTGFSETQLISFASYLIDPSIPAPQVGDISYLAATGIVIGNACAGGDTIGFDFTLPLGAALAISPQIPVKCFATKLATGDIFTNDPDIHCLQSPLQGNYGGLFFGWARVSSGLSFEIQIPVKYNQALSGKSGEELKVQTKSTHGERILASISPIVSERKPFAITYPTPATTEGTEPCQCGCGAPLECYCPRRRSTAQLSLPGLGGTATFEIGKSKGLVDWSETTAVPDTAGIYTIWEDWTGYAMEPSSTYWWRLRFLAKNGAESAGEWQPFTTNGLVPNACAIKTPNLVGTVFEASFQCIRGNDGSTRISSELGYGGQTFFDLNKYISVSAENTGLEHVPTHIVSQSIAPGTWIVPDKSVTFAIQRTLNSDEVKCLGF